jgi:ADP-sugar diphosphatase
MSSNIVINGINVYSNDTDVQSHFSIIVRSPKLIKFLENLDREFLEFKGLEIYKAKWFCDPKAPVAEKLGFLYMEMFATDTRNGKSVPGVIFLRGDAVAVYMRVIYKRRRYVVLTKQVRIPAGRITLEIPAGMMDAMKKSFAGVAMQEITEETGISAPDEDSLLHLGKFWPSSGGCDEAIELFYFETEINEEKFNKIQRETYGNENENESIQVILVPEEEYEEVLRTMNDGKAICAHYFAKEKGFLKSTLPKMKNIDEKILFALFGFAVANIAFMLLHLF